MSVSRSMRTIEIANEKSTACVLFYLRSNLLYSNSRISRVKWYVNIMHNIMASLFCVFTAISNIMCLVYQGSCCNKFYCDLIWHLNRQLSVNLSNNLSHDVNCILNSQFNKMIVKLSATLTANYVAAWDRLGHRMFPQIRLACISSYKSRNQLLITFWGLTFKVNAKFTPSSRVYRSSPSNSPF